MIPESTRSRQDTPSTEEPKRQPPLEPDRDSINAGLLLRNFNEVKQWVKVLLLVGNNAPEFAWDKVLLRFNLLTKVKHAPHPLSDLKHLQTPVFN